jgi:hypothetical protein
MVNPLLSLNLNLSPHLFAHPLDRQCALLSSVDHGGLYMPRRSTRARPPSPNLVATLFQKHRPIQAIFKDMLPVGCLEGGGHLFEWPFRGSL